MQDCSFTFDPKSGFWTCLDCKIPLSKKSICYRQLGRLPPKRECKAKLTPEEREKRAAAIEQQKEQAAHGPGTQLHRLLKRITGEGVTASCGCKSHIAEMNRNGPAWCRENVETIVGWLEEEIDRRLKAYERDGKKEEMGLKSKRPKRNPSWRLKLASYKFPGQRLAIKRLILMAIKRAEKDEKMADRVGGRGQ